MENTKIFLDNGTETNVNGIFYVFNSKYYFIYTMSELDENDYVRLYVVQVCKEIQNTPTGPIDTGYMLGMEINNTEEWARVQESITKIVEDKKNDTTNSDIQYLPISMLTNLKIISKNKFKLMKGIVQDNFKVEIQSTEDTNSISDSLTSIQSLEPISNTVDNDSTIPLENLSTIPTTGNATSTTSDGDVIIDYRSRFFEEQEKNQELEEQLKILNQKLEQIKNIIG
jgi:hypothetical protein